MKWAISYASVEDIIVPESSASSRPRGWYGVEVLRATIDGDELVAEDLRSHTIALNVGVPFRLEGRVDGLDASATMHPNTLKVVPAGAVSRWRWRTNGPIDILHMSVPEAAVRTFLEECELRPREILTRVGIIDSVVGQIGSALGAELAGESTSGRLHAETLAQDLVVHLVRTFSSAGVVTFEPPGRIGKRVMLDIDAYIDAHLGDEVTLAQLAAVARLSRFHFVRLFRRSVKVTPYQYVLERRVARAFRLIRATALPLRDVAAVVGLADQSHLTRLIRRRYGTTPARIRREAS